MLRSEPIAPTQQTPSELTGKLTIVNSDPRYSRVRLIEPTTLGYIYIGAEIQPRPTPFAPNSREKNELLARLKPIAHQLEQLDTVQKVTIFDAIVLPPPSAYVQQRAGTIHIPRFDVVVLIETTSPAAARDVQTTPAYQTLSDLLTSKAKQMYVITARNVKRIADVDKTRPGVFLFNYFVGDDPQVVLDLWDYLADWYVKETVLDNSTLLTPLEGERSDYIAINNARWDGSPFGVFLRQMPKKSFRSYVMANLEANRVIAMPVLYRVVNLPGRPIRGMPAWVWPVGALTLGAVTLGTWRMLSRRTTGATKRK